MGRRYELQVPATILTATDDPVIPIAEFRELQLAPSTQLVVTPHGGHCAFILDWSLRSWTDDFIVAHLHRALAGSPRNEGVRTASAA